MNDNKNLNLGWCQGYMGLKYHMEEALIEKNLNPNLAVSNPPSAIFSRSYINSINNLNHDKIYDFCFIGSISSNYKARLWVINFAKKYFTNNSIFINSDCPSTWISLGYFDRTLENICQSPRNFKDNQSKEAQYRKINENKFYFETMCKSKFILCPEGDAPWSFRFYEVLMCKSIPIVESWHHTYRTAEEASYNYKYILYNNIDKDINYDNYILENTNIFEKYHVLH